MSNSLFDRFENPCGLMEGEQDDTYKSRMTTLANTVDGGYVGRAAKDAASWVLDSAIERGEGQPLMNRNKTLPGKDAQVFQEDPNDEEESMQRHHGQGETEHETRAAQGSRHLLFPVTYIDSSAIAGKRIRFADIIATDMDTTSSSSYHLSSFARERTVHVIDNDSEETNFSNVVSFCDDHDEESSQMKEKLMDDHRLLSTTRVAGMLTVFGWAGHRILELFHRRVQQQKDEDEGVAGGDVWGDNPVIEHFQIKDVAKGLFTKHGNHGTTAGTASGGLSPGALTA
jgi:hypothetical protein